MSTNIAHGLQSVDWTAIGINFGIFIAAAGALFGGIWEGVKRLAKTENAKGALPSADGTMKIASATLVETTTMLMWSESNRSVCEAVHELKDVMQSVKDEIRELRHEVELSRVSGRK